MSDDSGLSAAADVSAPGGSSDRGAHKQQLAHALISIGMRSQTHARHSIENYAAVPPAARRCP